MPFQDQIVSLRRIDLPMSGQRFQADRLAGQRILSERREQAKGTGVGRRRLVMHLMVQPGVARAFMADPMTGDTGFLPRFLTCEPPSTIGTRFQARASRDDASLAAFSDSCAAFLKRPCRWIGKRGRSIRACCRCRRRRAGYSVVVCGPGDIAQAHQPDEYLELSEFRAGVTFMERLVTHLAA